MNINVIYSTKSNHTKKLADAIGEVCNVEAQDIKEPHNISETDLLFVGTGIYGGKPSEELLKYLDNLPANTIKGAAIFSNSCRGLNQTELITNILKNKGIEVLPIVFTCKSQFLFLNRKHPDANDIKKVKEFAQNVLSLVR